jgi:hypothetical protein
MSLSQSSQSGATMFFFGAISRYSLQSSCFFKKKQEGFHTIGARKFLGTTNILHFCLAEARRIFDC